MVFGAYLGDRGRGDRGMYGNDLGVRTFVPLSLSLSDLPFPFLLLFILLKVRNGGYPLRATKAGVVWRVHTVLEYHLWGASF